MGTGIKEKRIQLIKSKVSFLTVATVSIVIILFYFASMKGSKFWQVMLLISTPALSACAFLFNTRDSREFFKSTVKKIWFIWFVDTPSFSVFFLAIGCIVAVPTFADPASKTQKVDSELRSFIDASNLTIDEKNNCTYVNLKGEESKQFCSTRTVRVLIDELGAMSLEEARNEVNFDLLYSVIPLSKTKSKAQLLARYQNIAKLCQRNKSCQFNPLAMGPFLYDSDECVQKSKFVGLFLPGTLKIANAYISKPIGHALICEQLDEYLIIIDKALEPPFDEEFERLQIEKYKFDALHFLRIPKQATS
ncbi:MAG: hypothetical protein ABJO67_11770 [Pseudoruegeria sp.]